MRHQSILDIQTAMSFVSSPGNRFLRLNSGKRSASTPLPVEFVTNRFARFNSFRGNPSLKSLLSDSVINFSGDSSLGVSQSYFQENRSIEVKMSSASSTSFFAPVFELNRRRGTLATAIKVQPGDLSASFAANAFDGSSFQNAASINFLVDAKVLPSNISSGSVPGMIRFITQGQSRIQIDSNGRVSINRTGLQSSTFQVDGNVAFGYLNDQVVDNNSLAVREACYIGTFAGNLNKVLGLRDQGWSTIAGTPNKNMTGLRPAIVTLAQLAEHVKAIVDAMIEHGLIGE